MIFYVQNLLFECLGGPHMIMLQSLVIHIHIFIWIGIEKKIKFLILCLYIQTLKHGQVFMWQDCVKCNVVCGWQMYWTFLKRSKD
jgi:hypothetical protein